VITDPGFDRLCEELSRRAPGEWELYQKTGESLDLEATAAGRATTARREEGWAARWWEGDAPRFACGSSPENLERALAEVSRIQTARESPPAWPAAKSPARKTSGSVEPPPDLFEELQRQVSAQSRGDARLHRLAVRRGASAERIVNGSGLDVSSTGELLDGHAFAIGRQGSRACEARVVFRWDEGPDLETLARRLADRATLPLSDKSTPVDRGEWLLEPSVGAALLSGLAPLFCGDTLPKWVHRAELFAPQVTIADDASADALYDGEGTQTRRVAVVEGGTLTARLHDLRSARSAGAMPTGHGVRPSYRVPPAPGPRRIFFETDAPAPQRELLARVRRGLFASALTAPARLDFERDRYEVEFTGIAVVGGRAQGPVAGARARGRISQLLRRISGLSGDRHFFPMPYPAGAPTLLVERADFD
jgi:predicted Zn-dependent protease